MDFRVFAEEMESEIRAGRLPQAVRRLNSVNTATVPREWILRIANQCRRVGLVSMAMRLLAPIVRQSGKVQEKATPGELAEYGVLLHRCGALVESLEVLAQVDVNQAPEALLYRVFCLFNQWEYEQALPVLEDYLKRQQAPYMQTAGRLNYASALATVGRYEEALQRTTELIEHTKRNGYLRFQGNTHEVRAQIHLHLGDFSAARADLERASGLLSEGRAFDSFLVRKWRAILIALEERRLDILESLRRDALEAAEWESAREADRFALSVEFNHERFHHLMFGTPFLPYRRLVERELGVRPLADEYIFGESGAGRVLDLVSGLVEGGSSEQALKKKPHQMIEILMRDFYRGRRIGGLFRELFPGEYFDINSSPARVRQVIYRTRQWLTESGLPLEIREHHGFYIIQVGPGFGIRVLLERTAVDGFTSQWEILHTAFRGRSAFTAREARERLGIPRTSLQRLISWALSEGRLVRLGHSSSVSYRIADSAAGRGGQAA